MWDYIIVGAGSAGCVDGLRVADASVMPTVPSVPTHLSIVVVATRIAEAV